MKRLLLVAVLMLPTVVLAQSPTASEGELSLKVSNADVNTIGKALGLMPYGEVAALIEKLRQQIAMQQKPVEVPKVEGK